MLWCTALLSFNHQAEAHPNVFIDGGIDFVFDKEGALTALDVTSRYDLLETLYVFAKLEIVPPIDGALSDPVRRQLIGSETDWQADFRGAAHLTIDGELQVLSRPRSADVRLVRDRLEIRFRRVLKNPIPIRGLALEVAFYEATYYYAFSVTDPVNLNGITKGCSLRVTLFDPDASLVNLQATLAKLSREETPEIDDVGALFADRVRLHCA